MMHTKLLYFNTVPNRVNFYSLKTGNRKIYWGHTFGQWNTFDS